MDDMTVEVYRCVHRLRRGTNPTAKGEQVTSTDSGTPATTHPNGRPWASLGLHAPRT
jgi:hypothetical protein